MSLFLFTNNRIIIIIGSNGDYNSIHTVRLLLDRLAHTNLHDANKTENVEPLLVVFTLTMPQMEMVMEEVLDRRRYSENVNIRARNAPPPTTNRTQRLWCRSAIINAGDNTISLPVMGELLGFCGVLNIARISVRGLKL